MAKLSVKKLLLTGTALVAASAFSNAAHATDRTLAGGAIWGDSTGNKGVETVSVGDNVNIQTNTLTVSETPNTVEGGTPTSYLFNLGAVTGTTGSLLFTLDGGEGDGFDAHVASVNLTDSSSSLTITNTNLPAYAINVDFGGNVTVGSFTIENETSDSVTNQARVDGNIVVSGNTEVSVDGGGATILTVYGTGDFGGNVTVGGDTGNAYLTVGTTADGAATVGGNLNVSSYEGDATAEFYGDLTVEGDVTVSHENGDELHNYTNSNLLIGGKGVFKGAVTITRDNNCYGSNCGASAITVAKGATFAGAVMISSTEDDYSYSGSSYSALNINGGDAVFSDTVTVTGSDSGSARLNVSGDGDYKTTFAKEVTVEAYDIADASINLEGNATFQKAVTIDAGLDSDAELYIDSGSGVFNDEVSISADDDGSATLYVDSGTATTFAKAVTVDATDGGSAYLSVYGDTTFSDTVDVSSDGDSYAQLFVGDADTATFNEAVTIIGDGAEGQFSNVDTVTFKKGVTVSDAELKTVNVTKLDLGTGLILQDIDASSDLSISTTTTTEVVGDIYGGMYIGGEGAIIVEGSGGVTTFKGNIGTSDSSIDSLTVGGSSEAVFNKTVYANDIHIGGDDATFRFKGGAVGDITDDGNAGRDAHIYLAAGQTIDGSITQTGGRGDLNFEGSGTVTGDISGLDVINAGVAGSTVTLDGDIFNVNTLNINGTGKVVINNDTTDSDGNGQFGSAGDDQGIRFFADGSVTLNGYSDLGSSVDNVSGTSNIGSIVFGASNSGWTEVGYTAALKAITLLGDTAVSGWGYGAKTTNIADHELYVDSNSAFALSTGQSLALITTVASPEGHVTGTGNVTFAAGSVVFASITGALVDEDEIEIADGTAILSASSTVVSNRPGFTFTMEEGDDDSVILVAHTAAIASNGDKVLEQVIAGVDDTGDDDLTNILNQINSATTVEERDTLIKSILPTVDTSSITSALSTGTEVHGVIETRMNVARNMTNDASSGMSAGASGSNGTIWAQGFGQHSKQDLKDGIAGYQANTGGIVFGADTAKLVDNAIVGVSFSYANTDANSKNVNTTATNVDSYGVNVYGLMDAGKGIFVNGMAGFAYNQVDTRRHNVGGFTATGETYSNQYSARVAAGRDYKFAHGLTVTPTVTADYALLQSEGYSETGAGGLNLTIADNTINSVKVGAGVNAEWSLVNNKTGAKLKPGVHAAYTYDATADAIETVAGFAGGGGSFITTGADPDRSTLVTGASFSYGSTAGWDLSANYDYTYRAHYDAHSGVLRASTKF